MNYFFNSFIFIILFYLPPLFSRDIVLVSFNHFDQKAKLTQKILEEKIHIPSNLIKLRWMEFPCQTEIESDFHICIDESGEMIVLKRNEELLKNAFSVFQKGFEFDLEERDE